MITFLLGTLFFAFVTWLWLLVRIWKISALGAVIAFFCWPISIYFLFMHWGDENLSITAPFFANLLVPVVGIGMAFAIGMPSYDQLKNDSVSETGKTNSNSEMVHWCKEKNGGAAYDAGLGTCVETGQGQQVTSLTHSK